MTDGASPGTGIGRELVWDFEEQVCGASSPSLQVSAITGTQFATPISIPGAELDRIDNAAHQLIALTIPLA